MTPNKALEEFLAKHDLPGELEHIGAGVSIAAPVKSGGDWYQLVIATKPDDDLVTLQLSPRAVNPANPLVVPADRIATALTVLNHVNNGLFFCSVQLDKNNMIRLRMTTLVTETEADLFEEMLRRARTDLDGALIAACRAIASTKKTAKDIVAEYDRAVKKQEQDARKQAYLQ